MNIGLVLSGGMAKGAYQIGALRALNEFIPRSDIKYMSCASIGVLNGYAFATDNLDRAESMWKNVCSDNSRVLISQILRSSMLQQNIVNLYDAGKKLTNKLYASLLNISQRGIIYKDLSSAKEESIPLYLKASVAMPIYNRAVRIADNSYYDGAVVDNIPVYPLLKHNLDYLICIYFDDTSYKFENTYFDNKIIKITFPCDKVLKQSVQSVVCKRDSIEEMLSLGYEKTRKTLKYIFSDGYDNLEHIYEAIEFLNQSRGTCLRISGDVVTTNINKITQRLAKRRIL